MARKSNWTKYFSVKGIKPGIIQHTKLGRIDLSDESIPVEQIKALYDAKCVYIVPTEEGKKKYKLEVEVSME
ncbi:hypothetical protein DF185_19885 [Marinifilum breve]|uniref:Uncharacterized protein n=1 Tax=Marinifilum breve TaxID=2184082 RepID=A0A2V3ZV46_9BACT|nr:hypothetical protein [Marinifilum breve]PXX96903.1 hypothetical protein DF185_19885 [Marinifilum breve]